MIFIDTAHACILKKFKEELKKNREKLMAKAKKKSKKKEKELVSKQSQWHGTNGLTSCRLSCRRRRKKRRRLRGVVR